jgi:hypothetical protein
MKPWKPNKSLNSLLREAKQDEETEDYYNLDEEYAENMPCDNSGYCIGFSCSNYAKCKGVENDK